MKRRQLLLAGAAVGGLAMWPEARLLAQQTQDFIEGPPVADIPAQRLSKHVWMIYSPDGFPTPENKGMMANIIFVVTSMGVVVIDSGASLQIGQMAIRMIRQVTHQPVVAVFNTHYHGDHWLGNHAFVKTYGDKLPIYSLASTITKLKGTEGNLWRSLMERWTNQSTIGTQVVIPNTAVQHGQVIQFGDVSLRMHHYGTAHTPSDLSVEVVQDKVTAVGDIAMTNRIANMDEGSYPGTFKYYKALMAATGEQLWVPGHGRARQDLLKTYGDFMAGIWEPSLKAVEDGKSEAEARAAVMKDTRVASRAKTMDGFEGNIGKYISLAYLEAEKVAF
ncbi:MAG: MBL fold metallo-hydrolase [Limnohabitans sp.]|jgi:glyoxylase-like metal-dependent hydrolase (beta-lactamase superfamily II)|uniref:MBL fold metallo-hydrolase n=1 Tax=Limnohabitans sp. TaxID=1907725 RepID=UPI003918E8A0